MLHETHAQPTVTSVMTTDFEQNRRWVSIQWYPKSVA